MPLVADDLVTAAFGRLADVTDTYPTSRGPLYRRIGYRQRQLFAMAAKISPDRFGSCATANLTGGVADLNDIVNPTPTPELVQRVEIANAGTSPYAAGDQVFIVRADDQSAELPPRAMLRDRVLIGVGADLALVTSVKIFYPRLTDIFTETDTGKVVDLEAPWDTLLELDVARYTIEKCLAMPAELRKAAFSMFDDEEKNLLLDFLHHVAGYAPTVSRFQTPRIVRPRAEGG